VFTATTDDGSSCHGHRGNGDSPAAGDCTAASDHDSGEHEHHNDRSAEEIVHEASRKKEAAHNYETANHHAAR
jgi:hypothetical protein